MGSTVRVNGVRVPKRLLAKRCCTLCREERPKGKFRGPRSRRCSRCYGITRKAAKYNALRMGYVGVLSILALSDSPCAACGKPPPSTVDHVVPLSRGGRHEAHNLQPLCKKCNAKKGDRLVGTPGL